MIFSGLKFPKIGFPSYRGRLEVKKKGFNLATKIRKSGEALLRTGQQLFTAHCPLRIRKQKLNILMMS